MDRDLLALRCVLCGAEDFERHVALLHVLLLGLRLMCLYLHIWECKLADLMCEAPSHRVLVV